MIRALSANKFYEKFSCLSSTDRENTEPYIGRENVSPGDPRGSDPIEFK